MIRYYHHLKDYFVPHDGNNHIPHTLHPKRIIFHVGAAVVMKAIVFISLVVFPLSAWMSPDIASQESKSIIDATNVLRADLKLPILVENSKLDQAAASKVSDMLLNQYFSHVSPDGIDLKSFINSVGYVYSVAGENLAMGFNSVPDVMRAWEISPTHYANLTDPNYKDIGVAMNSGVYHGTDTAFIAQYFGRPVTDLVAAIAPPSKIIALSENSTSLAVRSPPTGSEKVLDITVKLPLSTASATAVVNNVQVALVPQADGETWQGNALIGKSDEKYIANPVVPASVKIIDNTGTSALASLDWSTVTPIKTSAYDQYSIFRRTPTSGMGSLLKISNVYFYTIFILISAALISLIIFRKKYHHRVLATSIASLIVIVVLIVI